MESDLIAKAFANSLCSSFSSLFSVETTTAITVESAEHYLINITTDG